MIQLKVYDTPAKETQYWIDLYETEPIKLTLSIEDITNADATSVFSRTFKVPGTRKNAEFFKNSFDVDGVIYDVTVKKPAEILVDGAEFRQGHVRLQRVFVNTELDRVDYELLFLGETRDFSSIIGDKGLCELDLPDLIGGQTGDLNDFVGPEDIVLSWQAYPQTASLTNGLHDGNIIYPLIDHGNTYDDTGTVGESRIAIGTGTTNTPNFTDGAGVGNNTDPRKTVSVDRFKPMIRAKRLIDQIFEDAGYTYTSSFFDSDLFHQIYISAFGNEAIVSLASDNGAGSENTAYGDNQNQTQHTYDRLTFPNNQIDPGNNLSQPSTSPYGSIYTAPGPGTYTITARCYYEGCLENSDYSCDNVKGSLVIHNYTTSQNLAVGTFGSGGGSTITATATGVPLATNDVVGIFVTTLQSTDTDLINNVVFEVTSAPGRYTPANGLDCQYKQIDFVKDILTSFRLVLSPDVNDPKNFIIEPWQTYINSGELYDWSKKLVEDKDVVIEPVFFSQSDVIDFKFQPGGDYTNIYHQQSFEKPYGYLEFSSGNDLLKGTREIKLLGIAPTELVNIQGALADDFVPIPQLHTHSSEDTGLQHLPIKPKTRMLFYNGLQPFTVTPPQDGWYIQNDPANRTVYPLVSPYETWPITDGTLNLNFANDIQYWGTRAGYNDTGVTLYENYWSRYIASLYNKYSRRVTANFILNNIDLNTFSFDDTIFVNGTYYRPEKIIDVEVGAYTEVKVQLLTANDYRPSVIPDQVLDIISVTGISGGCFNLSGQIDVVTNGTPGFTWTLSNGVSGTALAGAEVGLAPYSFSIYGVAAGNYTITITDSVGRSDSTTVSVPIGSETLPTASQTVIDATDCTTPCNGQVSVTPVGGVGPYDIYWYDAPTNTSFTRSDLCPGDYSYHITDSNGCMSAAYLATVECNTEGNTVWYYAQDLNCQQLSSQFVKVEVPAGTTPDPVNDIVTLQSYLTGDTVTCYRPVYQTTGTPDYFITEYWPSCEECQGIQEYYYNIGIYEPENSCTEGTGTNQAVKSNTQLAIGTTVKLTNIDPNYEDLLDTTTCYWIRYESNYPVPTQADVATVYETCESCQGITPDSYYIVLDCEGQAPPQTVRFTVPVTIGEVWQLDGGPANTCWQIVDIGNVANWSGLTGVTGFFNCAECTLTPEPSGFYRLKECGTDANPVYWTVPQELYAFNIGDTVQFTKNVDPSTIWCGEIVGIYESQVADATLFSAQTYGCGDIVHCNIPNP